MDRTIQYFQDRRKSEKSDFHIISFFRKLESPDVTDRSVLSRQYRRPDFQILLQSKIVRNLIFYTNCVERLPKVDFCVDVFPEAPNKTY